MQQQLLAHQEVARRAAEAVLAGAGGAGGGAGAAAFSAHGERSGAVAAAAVPACMLRLLWGGRISTRSQLRPACCPLALSLFIAAPCPSPQAHKPGPYPLAHPPARPPARLPAADLLPPVLPVPSPFSAGGGPSCSDVPGLLPPFMDLSSLLPPPGPHTPAFGSGPGGGHSGLAAGAPGLNPAQAAYGDGSDLLLPHPGSGSGPHALGGGGGSDSGGFPGSGGYAVGAMPAVPAVPGAPCSAALGPAPSGSDLPGALPGGSGLPFGLSGGSSHHMSGCYVQVWSRAPLYLLLLLPHVSTLFACSPLARLARLCKPSALCYCCVAARQADF